MRFRRASVHFGVHKRETGAKPVQCRYRKDGGPRKDHWETGKARGTDETEPEDLLAFRISSCEPRLWTARNKT